MKKNIIAIIGLSIFLVNSSTLSTTVLASKNYNLGMGVYDEVKSENESIIVDKLRNLDIYGKTSSSVTLKWDVPESVHGLVEYIIYKDGRELDRVEARKNGYTATDLSLNKIYGFKISARYSNGDESKPVSINIRTDKNDQDIIVSKPQNIKSYEVTQNSFKLSWYDPKNIYGLVEHIIYKDGKKLETIPAGTNKYTLDGLKLNTIYGVKVTSRYLNGEESKPISINVRTSK